jgi:hypothetical protein
MQRNGTATDRSRAQEMIKNRLRKWMCGRQLFMYSLEVWVLDEYYINSRRSGDIIGSAHIR